MTAAAKAKTTLAAALVAAQAELHAPAKNRTVTVRTKTGGTYSFEYATLDAIVEMLRPILTNHGLWFAQLCHEGQMVTRILHESGETLDCGLPMPSLPNAPQEAGSIITYFKRYSLCAAFGLVAEEDDDANVAEGNSVTARPANQNNGNGKPAKNAPFPQGPAKNITELKEKGREFWREVEGCGDGMELDALLASHTALQKQIAEALPDWWHGGKRGSGEEYDGLGTVITRRQLELSNEMADQSPLAGG